MKWMTAIYNQETGNTLMQGSFTTHEMVVSFERASKYLYRFSEHIPFPKITRHIDRY